MIEVWKVVYVWVYIFFCGALVVFVALGYKRGYDQFSTTELTGFAIMWLTLAVTERLLRSKVPSIAAGTRL